MFVMSLDKVITRLRTNLELDEKQFCEKFGIPLTTLKRWEHPGNSVSIDTLFKYMERNQAFHDAMLYDDQIIENIVSSMPLAQKGFFEGKKPDEEAYSLNEVQRIVNKAIRLYVKVMIEAVNPRNS